MGIRAILEKKKGGAEKREGHRSLWIGDDASHRHLDKKLDVLAHRHLKVKLTVPQLGQVATFLQAL